MDPVTWIVIASVIVLAAVGVVLWNLFGRGSRLDDRMGRGVEQGVRDAQAETARTRYLDGNDTHGRF